MSLSRLSPVTPIRLFRPNPNLEIAFDVRTRNPVYVLERLVVMDDDKKSKVDRQKLKFYEESALTESFRSKNSHYHGSGFDRGHMAPAADFHHSAKEMQDTFNFSNISPQNHNINAGIWAQLEDFCRQVADKAWKQGRRRTYVVTGPLWLPRGQLSKNMFQYSFPALGKPPSLVAVPTHFFKVVLVVDHYDDSNSSHSYQPVVHSLACFVVANKEDASNQHNDTPKKTLQDSLVRWTDLEAVSGLVFFPGLVNENTKAIADALTTPYLQLQNQQQPLLLTDGSTSSSKKRIPRTTLQHLCQNQQCQR